MWPNLIHCTVLSQAPRSEGHVMRKGVPGEYFKGCHKQARVLFLLLLIVTLAVVFKKFWRRVEPVKKVIQQPVDLGCLYTVQLPQEAQAWQVVSFTISPTTTDKCSLAARSKIRGNARGNSNFRIQAFGSQEMVTGSVTHIGNDTYNATLRLTFAGEYIILVILTYINNDSLEYRHHTKAVLQHVVNSPFDLPVSPGPYPRGYTRYCSQEESGTAPGRWVECGSIPGIERCGQWQLDPLYDFDQIHGFHWLPYFCQLHHYSSDEIKKCFAKQGWSEIVFTGDSHMRYRTYHWVTRLHGSCHGCIKTHVKMVFDKIPRIEWVFDARGTRWPLTFPNISMPHEIYVHPRTRRSMFSKELPSSVFSGKLFLMNFGHWILRESTKRRFMAEKLRAFVEAIQAMNNSGEAPKRFLWVNTVSLPWREDRAMIEWLENPSPTRVAQLNGLTDQAMRLGSVQIVDAFQISNSRIGATHDQTHYAKRMERGDCGGVVENAISNVIANALCNYDNW